MLLVLIALVRLSARLEAARSSFFLSYRSAMLLELLSDFFFSWYSSTGAGMASCELLDTGRGRKSRHDFLCPSLLILFTALMLIRFNLWVPLGCLALPFWAELEGDVSPERNAVAADSLGSFTSEPCFWGPVGASLELMGRRGASKAPLPERESVDIQPGLRFEARTAVVCAGGLVQRSLALPTWYACLYDYLYIVQGTWYRTL